MTTNSNSSIGEKVLVIVGVLFFVLLIAGAGFLVYLSVAVASLDNGRWEYTPGFTEEKFAAVTKGMTPSRVEELLGKPFDDAKIEYRQYTVKTKRGKMLAVTVEYHGEGRVRSFDPERHMLSDWKVWEGMSRAEAEAAFHPKSSKLLGYRHEWSYSRAEGNPLGYHPRFITFGHDGTVIEVERYDSENSD